VIITGYSGVFPALHLGFNRRIPQHTAVHEDEMSNTAKPWTFVCATLWHETESEIRQLLGSIYKLSSQWDRGLRNMTVLFMFDQPFDNGVGDKVCRGINI
jgi:hypothetical protein